jgi:hypothetical protein
MKKYNHAVFLGFEVMSDDPDQPTREEMVAGLFRRIVLLEKEEQRLREMQTTCDHGLGWVGAGEPSDSFEVTDDDKEYYERWLADGRPTAMSDEDVVAEFVGESGMYSTVLTDEQHAEVEKLADGPSVVGPYLDVDGSSSEAKAKMARLILSYPNVVAHLVVIGGLS